MEFSMTADAQERFLADVHVGIVAIPRPGRGPLTVPIWYDYEPGATVWMITGGSSLKGRLAATQERMSLCAQTEQAPYTYVTVEGPISIEPADAQQMLHMAIRYLGAEQGKAYAAQSPMDGSIVIRLQPEAWVSVDYGKREGS